MLKFYIFWTFFFSKVNSILLLFIKYTFPNTLLFCFCFLLVQNISLSPFCHISLWNVVCSKPNLVNFSLLFIFSLLFKQKLHNSKSSLKFFFLLNNVKIVLVVTYLWNTDWCLFCFSTVDRCPRFFCYWS